MKYCTALIAAVAFFLVGSERGYAREYWMNYGQSNKINDVAIRSQYIWCATSSGVVRWDTRDMSYRKFTMIDGLPHHVINSLDIAPDGTIWCGTNAGLVQFVNENWWKADGFPQMQFGASAVEVGPDGTVWCAFFVYDPMSVRQDALARYDGSAWNVLPALPYGTQVEAISVTHDNTAWLQCVENFFTYDGEKLAPISFIAQVVAVGPDGVVWAGTSTGIRRYDGQNWTDATLPGAYSVTALTVLPDGTVWAGATGGLLRYNGAEWTWYEASEEINLESCRGLAVDSSGTVWVGSPTGLIRYDGVAFSVFRVEEELINANVHSIGLESNGTVWAVTSGGVSRFDGRNWRSFATVDGLPVGEITSLAIAPGGGVWIGSAHGAARFDGTGWRIFTTVDGLADSMVTSIAAGPDGAVWFGTNNGLSRFDGTTWRTYTSADGLMGNPVRDIAITDSGILWVYGSGGISRFDGVSWTSSVLPVSGDWYFSVKGLCTVPGNNGVYVGGNMGRHGTTLPGMYNIENTDILYIDFPHWLELGGGIMQSFCCAGRETIWFGLAYNYMELGQTIGAVRYDATALTKKTVYREHDGLAGYNTQAIAIAPDGAVWFGTENGISRFEYLSAPSAIGDEAVLPKTFAILGNTPNPFNPSTTISFTLPATGPVELTVYSITGQKVRTLVPQRMAAGAHSAVWDGKDDAGNAVSSGVYIARLRAGKTVSSHKMLLMK